MSAQGPAPADLVGGRLAAASNSDHNVGPERAAFQSQFESFDSSQGDQNHNVLFGQKAFQMNAMAGALPMAGQPTMNPLAQYGMPPSAGAFIPGPAYWTDQSMQYSARRDSQFDMLAAARMQQQQQQQQLLQGSYTPYQQQFPMDFRQPHPYPNAVPFSPVESLVPYPAHRQQYEPTYVQQAPYGRPSILSEDSARYSRGTSEQMGVPSHPRGPPRKPKQSGYALWCGNLPSGANVTDLKDHFSQDATKDIESLFLISKSNCAFVNYRTEAACAAAMTRFHDSRFYGVRLVCRLRRGVGPERNTAISTVPGSTSAAQPRQAEVSIAPTENEPSSPIIVGTTSSAAMITPKVSVSERVPPAAAERYFIIKSLTVQDLEASVRNGVWATQSHNETVLNRAYEEADNVYLVFSANKAGEYFGYARMASTISGEPVSLTSNETEEATLSPGALQSIPTPATATAPKGHIVDDSARGTVFWEADLSDDEGDEEQSPTKVNSESSSRPNWGRQFTIEWISTTRLPFYRTRGLRNRYNGNREVKIARDGTELEPNVGRRLVQMFHRPLPGPGVPELGVDYR